MKTTLQLATIFALFAVVGIPAAFASGSQVSIDTVGDAVIDLNASEMIEQSEYMPNLRDLTVQRNHL